MPITPPPVGYPLESAAQPEAFDPRALVAGSDQMAQQQPDMAAQGAGAMDLLKGMLGQLAGLSDQPGLSEGARLARQGIVQMMLALNSGANQPTSSELAM